MTVANQNTLVGVFADRTQAQDAVRSLKQAGFRDDQLGILSPGANESGAKPGFGNEFPALLKALPSARPLELVLAPCGGLALPRAFCPSSAPPWRVAC